MPEGDTVWNTARVVERALAGEVLTKSDFRVPQLATADLSGWTVESSGSRGKHLLLRVVRDGDRRTLHSHLRMEGAWRAYAPGERWTGGPGDPIPGALYSPPAGAGAGHPHPPALLPPAPQTAE